MFDFSLEWQNLWMAVEWVFQLLGLDEWEVALLIVGTLGIGFFIHRIRRFFDR